MPTMDVEEWAREFSRPGALWFAKRLSANDTQQTGAHQAGPYIPKQMAFEVFPELCQPEPPPGVNKETNLIAYRLAFG